MFSQKIAFSKKKFRRFVFDQSSLVHLVSESIENTLSVTYTAVVVVEVVAGQYLSFLIKTKRCSVVISVTISSSLSNLDKKSNNLKNSYPNNIK